ncbi:hypothetical protein H6P81_017181 [Aristolochia fimbriata]|uniref:Uncharacterized protein n=1 Tax=Aristolochia fimbriata TaxID=158543 RepID=A0AAV7E1R7_ARIFI|nr:hypothetical protein H6P81_017181 [Aristolochia fimbriata]
MPEIPTKVTDVTHTVQPITSKGLKRARTSGFVLQTAELLVTVRELGPHPPLEFNYMWPKAGRAIAFFSYRTEKENLTESHTYMHIRIPSTPSLVSATEQKWHRT